MNDMILFRCDANATLGLGHLQRCCTLAAEIVKQGGQCIMMGPELSYFTKEFNEIFTQWIPRRFDSDLQDVSCVIKVADSNQVKKIVLDDYRITDAYQLSLQAKGMHWLQFDGTGKKKIWADLLVNAMPIASQEMYSGKVFNPLTHFLLGPSYALVRPEFRLGLSTKKKNVQANRGFVFAGGGDDKGALKILIQSLYEILDLTVVTTVHNPGLSELQKWITSQKYTRVQLHINPDNISALMQSCDLAFISAGTVTYEINCLGLPMVLFSIADNQIEHARAWSEKTGARYLGDHRDLTANSIQEAAVDVIKFPQKPMKRLVDGLGSQRVAEALMELTV